MMSKLAVQHASRVTSTPNISPSDHLIRRDITAVGASYYHFSEFPRMLRLYRNGLRLPDLISHCFPFPQAAAAFETFVSGQSAKVLLEWENVSGSE